MKIILLFIVLMVSVHAFAEADLYDKECIYVAAHNGLNLREAPVDGAIIMKLPYGTKLDWSPPGGNDEKVTIQDNGESIEGYWVKVWLSVPYEELQDNLGGYVFSGYLKYHLDTIPEDALYLYNSISTEDDVNMYTLDGVDYPSSFRAEYQVDEDTYNYSAYIDCYPRYQEHKGIMYANFNGKEINIQKPADTLRSLFKMELVDDTILNERVHTGWEIDTTWQPTIMPMQGYEDQEYLSQFYLPVKENDSLLLESGIGEYDVNVHYIGEIKEKNAYVIGYDFEGWEYSLINKRTGAMILSSYPFTSPMDASGGSYGVFFDTVFYQSGAQLSINQYDGEGTAIKAIHVSFQSWEVDRSIHSAFWISNDTFVLRVHPIDSSVEGHYYDDRTEHQWQYLKITIR